jgi:hypothetical protein
VRTLGQDRQQDRARSDAQVQQLEMPLLLEGGQNHVEDGLGVGPGDQDVRIDVQHDLPEALAADDPRDGLTPFATGDVVLVHSHLLVREDAVGVGDQFKPGDARRCLQQ